MQATDSSPKGLTGLFMSIHDLERLILAYLLKMTMTRPFSVPAQSAIATIDGHQMIPSRGISHRRRDDNCRAGFCFTCSEW